jgi:hypothetical protein
MKCRPLNVYEKNKELRVLYHPLAARHKNEGLGGTA